MASSSSSSALIEFPQVEIACQTIKLETIETITDIGPLSNGRLGISFGLKARSDSKGICIWDCKEEKSIFYFETENRKKVKIEELSDGRLFFTTDRYNDECDWSPADHCFVIDLKEGTKKTLREMNEEFKQEDFSEHCWPQIMVKMLSPDLIALMPIYGGHAYIYSSSFSAMSRLPYTLEHNDNLLSLNDDVLIRKNSLNFDIFTFVIVNDHIFIGPSRSLEDKFVWDFIITKKLNECFFAMIPGYSVYNSTLEKSYITKIIKFEGRNFIKDITISDNVPQKIVGCFNSGVGTNIVTRLVMYSSDRHEFSVYDPENGNKIAIYRLPACSLTSCTVLDDGTIAFIAPGLKINIFSHQISYEKTFNNIHKEMLVTTPLIDNLAAIVAVYAEECMVYDVRFSNDPIINFFRAVMHPGFWESLSADCYHIKEIRKVLENSKKKNSRERIIQIIQHARFMINNPLRKAGLWDFFVRSSNVSVPHDCIMKTLLTISKHNREISEGDFEVVCSAYEAWYKKHPSTCYRLS
jgi:hypothetical protein